MCNLIYLDTLTPLSLSFQSHFVKSFISTAQFPRYGVLLYKKSWTCTNEPRVIGWFGYLFASERIWLCFYSSFGDLRMAAVSLLVLIVLSQFVLLHFAGAEEENSYHHRRNCPPFPCGKLGEIGFPYTPRDRPECGLFVVGGCEGNIQKVQLKQGERWYQVDSISQAGTVTIYDEVLAKQLETKDCESLKNLSLSFPNLPYVTFQILSNLTLCKCNSPLNTSKMQEFSYAKCKNSTIYYSQPQGMPKPPGEDQYDRLSSLCNCPIIELPFTHLPPDKKHNSHLFRMLTAKVSVGVTVSRKCRKCHYRGGQCLVKKQRFHCSKGICQNLCTPLVAAFSHHRGCCCIFSPVFLDCTSYDNPLVLSWEMFTWPMKVFPFEKLKLVSRSDLSKQKK